MKKSMIFLLIAVCSCSVIFAQQRQRTSPRENNFARTIEGTLKLERGSVAVQSGDRVYLVPTLTRYIGFIEGLKEDAGVSIEGYLLGNVIHPSKVIIADRTYEFPNYISGMQSLGMAFMNLRNMRGNFNMQNHRNSRSNRR